MGHTFLENPLIFLYSAHSELGCEFTFLLGAGISAADAGFVVSGGRTACCSTVITIFVFPISLLLLASSKFVYIQGVFSTQ